MKILVVDDIETNRMLLSSLLSSEGHEIIEACDGKEAINLFLEEKPSLILMDVMMPNMDGIEATKIIKANTEYGYIPIIFLTALDNEEDLKHCLDAGGDDFMSKPFSDTVLRSKIKAHGRIQKLNDQLTEQHEEVVFLHNHLLKEQEMAELVFHQAMKNSLTECNNIRTHISPASSFNGDVLLSSESPTGSIYVIIGDFTGHGLPASLGSLPLSQVFFAMAKKAFSVGEIANEINNMLLKFLPDHMFCACTLLELNAKGDRISFWSGGMLDGYIVSKENGLEKYITSQHMPLGVMPQEEFDSRYDTIELNSNQVLYFYTDGIPETENILGEFFGQERLESLFKPGIENHFDALLYGVQAFRGNRDQNDDITLLAIKAGEIEFDQGSHYSAPETNYDMLIPWNLEVNLTGSQIAQYEPVPYIIDLIGQHPSLRDHREFIGLLLSELYANALDHGILGLNSIDKQTEDGFLEFYQKRAELLSTLDFGYIKINISLDSDTKTLLIKVKDSGKGFDFESQHQEQMNDNNSYGRGLPLLKSLCNHVEYHDQGSMVVAHYLLENKF